MLTGEMRTFTYAYNQTQSTDYILCFLSSFSLFNDNFNNVSIITRHNRCKRINTYTYTYNVMSQHCQNVNIICSLEKCSRLRMHITRHN